MEAEPQISFKESSVLKKSLIKLRHEFDGQISQKSTKGMSVEDEYRLRRNGWLTKVVANFEAIIEEGYIADVEIVKEMKKLNEYLVSPEFHNKPVTDLSDIGAAVKLVDQVIKNLE